MIGALTGCFYQSNQIMSSPTITPANTKPTDNQKNTRLLYYYTDPRSLAQSISSVSGSFYWQDGCIYLLSFSDDKKIIKKTAMFPKLPKHEVVWHEKDKTITLTNRDNPPKVFIFNMGDYISTNGRTTKSIPDNITLENIGDEQCLSKDGIAFIGTIGIEKIGQERQ